MYAGEVCFPLVADTLILAGMEMQSWHARARKLSRSGICSQLSATSVLVLVCRDQKTWAIVRGYVGCALSAGDPRFCVLSQPVISVCCFRFLPSSRPSPTYGLLPTRTLPTRALSWPWGPHGHSLGPIRGSHHGDSTTGRDL